MRYSDLEYEIFSRQFILQNFNDENIYKLGKANIAVIGLGGIGCPLIQYMVSSGLRTFCSLGKWNKDKNEGEQ